MAMSKRVKNPWLRMSLEYICRIFPGPVSLIEVLAWIFRRESMPWAGRAFICSVLCTIRPKFVAVFNSPFPPAEDNLPSLWQQFWKNILLSLNITFPCAQSKVHKHDGYPSLVWLACRDPDPNHIQHLWDEQRPRARPDRLTSVSDLKNGEWDQIPAARTRKAISIGVWRSLQQRIFRYTHLCRVMSVHTLLAFQCIILPYNSVSIHTLSHWLLHISQRFHIFAVLAVE